MQASKHPSLVTVIVDGDKSLTHQVSPKGVNEHHWRLPSTDPRDDGKYLFRLHTIDLYFWTDKDAHTFIEGARSVLRREQMELDEPAAPTPHPEVSSPVVQNLENIALSDPAYRNGQTRDSRSIPYGAPTTYGSVPPPPTQQEHRQEQTKRLPEAQQDEKPQDPTAFVPLAYNPAAPPAPEKIKHREKTPPPPEFEQGTGLSAAAYHDDVPNQAQSRFHAPPSGYPSHSFSPAPANHAPTPASYSPQASQYGPSTVPTASTPSQAYSMSSLPPHSSMSSYPRTSAAPTPPSGQPSFQDPNQHLYPQGTKPLDSPAAQILGPSYITPHQPLQHLQPQYADYLSSRPTLSPSQQPPVGGYSDYKYDQQQSRQHNHHHRSQDADPNEIHKQLYRPTEEEANSHKSRKSSKSSSRPNGLEARADRVETKVNSFLKRLEKKIG